MGETNGRQGLFSEDLFVQTQLGTISVSGDEGHSPLPGTGEGGTCTGEIYALLLDR